MNTDNARAVTPLLEITARHGTPVAPCVATIGLVRVDPVFGLAFYRVVILDQWADDLPTRRSVIWQGHSLRQAHKEAHAYARAVVAVAESGHVPQTTYLRTPRMLRIFREAGQA